MAKNNKMEKLDKRDEYFGSIGKEIHRLIQRLEKRRIQIKRLVN